MVDRNHRIRFGNNNWLEGMDETTFTPSTSLTGLTSAVEELQKAEKSLAWTPTGRFEVGTGFHRFIYVGIYAIELTTGSYASGDLLAAHITTEMNSNIPGGDIYTCSFESSNKFRFTINSGTLTLVLSTSTDMWDTLGFTGSVDVTGSTLDGTAPRIHTSEYFDIDLGTNLDVSLVSLLGEHSEGIKLSDSAIVTVYLNNINDFDNPDETVTAEVHTSGIFLFLDTLDSTSYRYIRVEIQDRENPLGNEGLNLSYLYVGDYLTLESRNFSRGFNIAHVINTKRERSEGGQLFHNRRPSHVEISNIGLRFLDKEDVKAIRQFLVDVDIDTPFILSLDPTLTCTDEIQDLTYLVVMDGQSTPLNHIRSCYYSLVMKFREIL